MNQDNKNNLPLDPQTAKAVQEIEKGVLTFRAVMNLAIRNTVSEDWINYGGKAWLSAPASERIARALGLSVKDWTWRREDSQDDKGPFFVITSEGFIGHAPTNQWTPAIGIQWSRKPFFFKDNERERHISEIHPGNIIKDAYSDMYRNGVTRFLGLRGLSWSTLKEFGIDKAKAQTVEFRTRKKGSSRSREEKKSGPDEVAGDGPRNTLAASAARKVVNSTKESILTTLPADLKMSELRALSEFVIEAPAEIEDVDWIAQVQEVTG